MKTKITKILCVFALAIMLCTTFFKVTTPAFAEETSQLVVLNGCGIVEAMPDAIEMTFCIKGGANEFKQTQELMDNSYQTFAQSLKTLDQDIQTYIAHSSIYPNHDALGYNATLSVVVKTKKLELVDQIMESANQQNISSFYGVNYILEDKQSIYNNALALAKQDAEQKISSMYENYKLVALKECNICSYSKGQKDSKIVVEACVKAIFEVNLEKTSENTDKISQYV